MALIPVRNLGQYGIIPDQDPYAVPLNAFTSGSNVLFDEGKVLRSPVFKTLYTDLKDNEPVDSLSGTQDTQPGSVDSQLGSLSTSQRFISSYATNSKEVIIVCDTTGVVREYQDGTEVQVTPSGIPVTNANPWTHCQAAGLSVLASKGRIPAVRNLTTEFIYGPMRNNWDPTWTCGIMRSFGDFLLALDVTKGTQEYPTMVKWCHPLQYSPDPNSGIDWDATLTTNLAGENIFGQLTTPIRDGLSLSNIFVIYSKDQVWGMERTQSTEVFNYRRLFPNGGVINVNCVAEVEGKHYVFGEEDFYVHDSVTQKPLGDERVKRYVYTNLDRTNKVASFVHHDSSLNLIYFCYRSKEADASFLNTAYCNKAAVYNYRNDTWTFMDVPNIVGACEVDISLTVAGYMPTSPEETPKVTTVLGVKDVTNGVTSSRVYVLDTPDEGIVHLPVAQETVKQAFVQRTGLDLDKEANFQLRSYKLIKSFVPQVRFHSGNTLGQLTFTLGASDQVDGPVIWQTPLPFDHINDYKVDTRASGRYLAFRISSDTADLFRFSGFDLETIAVAKR